MNGLDVSCLQYRLTEAERQEFNEIGGINVNGHFSPTDEDVPLRLWLREYSPAEAT